MNPSRLNKQGTGQSLVPAIQPVPTTTVTGLDPLTQNILSGIQANTKTSTRAIPTSFNTPPSRSTASKSPLLIALFAGVAAGAVVMFRRSI